MRELTRALAGLLVALVAWCCVPARAHAQAPASAPESASGPASGPASAFDCSRLLAVDSLEPSERARVQAVLCPDDAAARPDPAQLHGTLRELITSGDWTAELAVELARKLALAPTQAELPRARRALDAMLANPRCGLRDFLDQQIDLALANQLVASPRSYLADAPRSCTAGVPADELAALSEIMLVGYYGHADDVFEAVIADPQPAHVAPLVHAGARGRAQVLLLPKRSAAVVFVREHDLALPWRRHLATDHALDFALRPHERHECLKVEFTASVDGQPWHVVIDGVDFPLQPEFEPGRSYAIARLDLVDVPPDVHTVRFVHDGKLQHRADVPPTGTRRSCALLEVDLRGLRPGYGLTRLVIDERCQQRGLVPAQVRTLVDGYFEAHAIDLIHLDVIVEIVSSFADIESSLSLGRDNGEGNSERELAAYSGELLRQGVAELLTLSVSCAEQGEDMIIVGQVIHLERFSQRERSTTAGRDISEILGSATAIVEQRGGRRQGFEQVLGELLGYATVHLDALPGDVDLQDPVSVGYRVTDPGDGARTFEFGMALVEREHLCAEADDLANLAAFDGAVLREAVANDAVGVLVQRELVELPAHQHSLAVTRDVPLSGPGRYLVWIRDVDGDALSAACFRVNSRDVILFAQFGGLGSSHPGPLWAQRSSYVRTELGILYPVGDRGHGQFGGQIGYSNTTLDSDAPGSWDDITVDTLDTFKPNGDLDLHWTRHGLNFAALVGFDVPLGPCGYPFPTADDAKSEARRARFARRCAKPFHRRWSFSGRLSVGGSFGFLDLSKLPANFSTLNTGQSGRTIVTDFDAEVSVQLMVFARFSKNVGVYVYHQVLVTDPESLVGEGETGTVTDSFSALNLIGVGVGWTRRSR